MEQCYAKGETDEFLKPGIFAYGNEQRVRDNDVVFFFNFRADRARQMSDAFLYSDFDGFDREVQPKVHYVTLTEYDAKYPSPIVFEQEQLDNIFGQIVSEAGKTQLRIAETEKYAHVTFFFNGGVETQFPGEDRILVPSPREVATYDLKPQMSAEEVADKFVEAADKYDVIIMNFANGDMVGHTGYLEAGVAACEAVDNALEKCVKKILELGGKLLITADHGNAEHMRNEDGSPNTAHTTNLVDLIYVAEDKDEVKLIRRHSGGRGPHAAEPDGAEAARRNVRPQPGDAQELSRSAFFSFPVRAPVCTDGIFFVMAGLREPSA